MLQSLDFWGSAIIRKNGLHPLLTADVYRVISVLVKYSGNGVSRHNRCVVLIMKKSSSLCASHCSCLRMLFCFDFNMSSVKVSSLSTPGPVLHFRFIHSLTHCNFGGGSKSNSAAGTTAAFFQVPFFFFFFKWGLYHSGFSSTTNTQHFIRIIAIKAKYWSPYLAEQIICHLGTIMS